MAVQIYQEAREEAEKRYGKHDPLYQEISRYLIAANRKVKFEVDTKPVSLTAHKKKSPAKPPKLGDFYHVPKHSRDASYGPDRSGRAISPTLK